MKVTGKNEQQIILSGLFFAFSAYLFSVLRNVAIKKVCESLPFIEVAFAQFAFGAIFLIPIIPKLSLKALVPEGTGKLHLARASLGVVAITLFIYAIPYLPLSVYMALSYTNPLILAVLSLIFLRESIPALRWLAIGLGFIGVLLIAHPQTSASHFATCVLMLGCLSAASSDIFVKTLSSKQSSSSIVFNFFTLGSLTLAPFLLFVWRTPTLIGVVLLVCIGLVGVLSQLALTKAFSYIPASLVAPVSYTSLIWATSFGFMFWHEFPSSIEILGSLCIIADGFLAYFSARLKS